MGKAKDITGRRFGKLVAIRRVENSQGSQGRPHGNVRWLCICDCGKECIKPLHYLEDDTHLIRSCGCSRIEDFSGKVFDYLTVIQRSYNHSYRGKGGWWLCRCICGNEKIVSSGRLKDHTTKSCGCKSKELISLRNTQHGRYANPGSMPIQKDLCNKAYSRAKRDGLPCNLTPSDIIVPKYCPLLGIELKINKKVHGDGSPSLDKIIPALGYVRGNVWVVSWRANMLKHDANVFELLSLADNLKNKIEESGSVENKSLTYCI